VVRLAAPGFDASRSGEVKLTARCPATERSCRVSVRIARGDRLLAHGTITIAGGRSRHFTVRLSAAALRRLGRAGRLKAIAVLTGRDAGGNAKTRHIHLTLLAPGR
jgi:hypothetical protein